MNKNSVQIQIAKQLPITLGSKILIDDHSVAIHEAIMCGGVTTIRGYLGNKNQMNIDNLATQTPEEKEAFDLIDTAPHQYEVSKFSSKEWNGEGLPPVGVECEVLLDCSGKWKLCEILFSSKESVVVVKLKSGSEIALDPFASSFRKPETPQQREERERANAIYDMCASADNFTEQSNFWAGKFYDLGYRKESN